MRPTWFKLAAAALCGILAVNLGVRLERLHTREGAGHHSLYLPSGKYLRHASLGFTTLVADALYLWSIQYYSSPHEDRWRYLYRFYDVITDLDPRYVDAYLIGSLILAWESGNPEAAMRLLDKGVRKNPDDWMMAFEAGYFADRDLRDRSRALEYFEKSCNHPEAPKAVCRWYHHVRALEDEASLEDTLSFWLESHRTASTNYERFVSERHIHDLTIKLHLRELNRIVREYHSAQGRFPFSLEELAQKGWLEYVPTTPDEEAYLYDRQTGAVESPKRLLTLRER